MAISKFRPVLNASQIKWILDAASKDDSHVAKSLLQSLALFNFKIENQITQPAYIVQPKLSLNDSLGFTDKQNAYVDTDSPGYRWANDLMTPEEELAYENSLNQIAKGA